MRVLVTGGCGFIGTHLVNKLLADGHWVEVIDNLTGVGSEDRIVEDWPGRSDGTNQGKRYRLHIGSLQDRGTGPDMYVPDSQIDVIYHLAAVSRTVPAINNPWRCMETNVMGTVNMLELARELKVPRVVMSSSNVVYATDTPYKASKLMMEEACKAYHETYGVSVICLRYSNVYGPGFAKGDLACLASMRDSLVDRGYLEITGDGEQTRDSTYVGDIVEGNLKAAGSDYCGTVDLCTGVNHTMNQAAAMLKSVHGGNTPQLKDWETYKTMQAVGWYKRVEDRRGDCKHITQDPGPAKEILGWEAKVRFEDGVKDVWRY